ncbi:MAG: 4-(cytidine 5'-diphospho)-2-C-methyl-D-erythritol kinase [bacterium]|nr:4-(cytidine 5'-diphospho)-2-C-methyl-D-erythritol kinase [bacterium]
MPSSVPFTATAPAKINLALQVHGRRQDGFHELTSLVAGLELSDEVTFSSTGDRGVVLTCDDPALPTGPANLVIRAAEALADRLLSPPCGVRIELRKRIPVAAGLGGGSSDAAATLAALNVLWDAGLSDEQLVEIGARLGSDVPLFFFLPAAVIRGRGERVQPVALSWSGWVVLAHGGWEVLSREVYANWRESDQGERRADTLDRMLACRRAVELGPLLVNELEPAVYRTVPGVCDFREGLDDLTGISWRISGAGSTAMALFDQESEARRTAAGVTEGGLADRVMVVRTLGNRMNDSARRKQHGDFRDPREAGEELEGTTEGGL